MKKFRLLNNVTGWLVFAIAAITYLLTIEPTASFWDCGEFISSAFKLEVGHPPGAPLFMMIARIFTLFASGPQQVAAMVNTMSALCSAFTILFLFWTITHLARRVVISSEEDFTLGRMIAILGSGIVGALAFTWSDSFWFSAVEGEVYAFSSLFTALVVWCMLKWEDADTRNSSSAIRWIILIAYLMGLSIGVHLLNLLAIPALVLIYYFKKYPITPKGVIGALAISVAILIAVLYGMVPGFVKVARLFELLFVNGMGLPFNSGTLVYVILAFASLAWGLYETQKGKHHKRIRFSFLTAITMLGIPFLGESYYLGFLIIAALAILLFYKKDWNYKWLNTIMLCMTVILIGYSSFAMIVIRSLSNPPMDQNSPEDVFTLQSYLNREQYGDRPLLYGPVYSAPHKLKEKGQYCIPQKIMGATVWQKAEKMNPNDPDRYENMGRKFKGYKKDSRFNMLFPRMYSSSPSHIQGYKDWANIKGKSIRTISCGRRENVVKPTFGENLQFFFSYQVNFMYWRYFMWNFAGRQNDLQSSGEIDKGNWISGISFIDSLKLGDQAQLNAAINDNKGHNVYYMLPFLLGILGLAWQLKRKNKGKQGFWIVFTLFIMTGLAIVVYLNQTPYQPRERDYAYTGSFYAFAIWIGLGVMGIYELLKKYLPDTTAAAISTIVCLFVPILMVSQTWDDHDRSNRTVARDFGLNYLNSCDKNAIFFCNGDNDTFPVWYNQEVEGNRTDVRPCNLSYLQTDWYIDQMKREAYESQPLPIPWEHPNYRSGFLENSIVKDLKPSYPLKKALDLLVTNKRFVDENQTGTILSKNLTLDIDKDEVINTGSVALSDTAMLVDQMNIPMRQSLTKAQLMVLNMIANNNWERPIYFAVTVGDEYYPQLRPYLQLEGMAYRLTPIKNTRNSRNVNTNKMFTNMVFNFEYGNINDSKVYLDEQHMRMAHTLRMMFGELTHALIEEGQLGKAEVALDKCMAEVPVNTVEADYSLISIAQDFYSVNRTSTANDLMYAIGTNAISKLAWTASLSREQRNAVSRDMSMPSNYQVLQIAYQHLKQHKNEKADELYLSMQEFYHFVK